MPFRAVKIPQVPGTLWLASMPGRFEPWAEFLAEQRRAQLALVLCLAPRSRDAGSNPENAVQSGLVDLF